MVDQSLDRRRRGEGKKLPTRTLASHGVYAVDLDLTLYSTCTPCKKIGMTDANPFVWFASLFGPGSRGEKAPGALFGIQNETR